MDFAFLTGHDFSLAERTAIQTRAAVLVTETKQQRVKIWGKVYGYKADYAVIQCIGLGALSTCLTFYSTDGGINFTMLETCSAATAPLCGKINGVYMGDASYEYRVADGDKTTAVKESERLAYFIATHDEHCRVIPRGAQLLAEDDSVRLNATFEGLDRTEAGKLSSFVHLRDKRKDTSLLEKEGVLTQIDFLDPLAEDTPQGIWTLKYDATNDVVYGQSLKFPGAVFYHQPETSVYNNIYMGDGVVNADLSFMM